MFLDIFKALDIVWREGLIYKLKQNGVYIIKDIYIYIYIIKGFLDSRKESGTNKFLRKASVARRNRFIFLINTIG